MVGPLDFPIDDAVAVFGKLAGDCRSSRIAAAVHSLDYYRIPPESFNRKSSFVGGVCTVNVASVLPDERGAIPPIAAANANVHDPRKIGSGNQLKGVLRRMRSRLRRRGRNSSTGKRQQEAKSLCPKHAAGRERFEGRTYHRSKSEAGVRRRNPSA